MSNKKQANPNFCRDARRAIQQLTRTLDKRQDQVEKQDRVINFFVQFLSDQNFVLNVHGLFDGALPTFHTVGRDGQPDSRVYQFHELQQQALKDMLTHNFDNFRVRNDAHQNARQMAHQAEAARLVSWRNRAIAAENEIIANIAAAGDVTNKGPPSAPTTNQNAPNNDDEPEAQANEAHATETQANDANENQVNADVSYDPASYKTAYPANGNKANDSVADKATEKVDVNAPGLETKIANRKVSDALTENKTSIEATAPIYIQPKSSTPVIKKHHMKEPKQCFTMPLSLDPVDRLGLNLLKVRTKDKVQAWLDTDPEEEDLPFTPEYVQAASTIEIEYPEASDLPPTPENNSVGDVAIGELAVNDDQADEQVEPETQLITAGFRTLFLSLFS